MREQNELLRGILRKNYGITEREIFDSVRKSADEYYRRTGREAFLQWQKQGADESGKGLSSVPFASGQPGECQPLDRRFYDCNL